MPLTFAHPAVVLPFIRSKYFSASALVCGSLAPDFEYFIKMRTGAVHGHTLLGMFYFDLPIAFLLLYVFHVLVKDPLLENLPLAVSARLQQVKSFNFPTSIRNRFLILTYSALLGIVSHLLWDSFTHNNGMMASIIPWMNTTFFKVFGTQYPAWFALQQVSTLVGLIIISVYVARIKTMPVATRPAWWFWPGMVVVSGLVYYARTYLGPPMKIGDMIVSVFSAMFVGLIAVSIVYKKRST